MTEQAKQTKLEQLEHLEQYCSDMERSLAFLRIEYAEYQKQMREAAEIIDQQASEIRQLRSQ